MACAAWSSLMMNRIFGRSAARLPKGIASETKVVQINGVQFFIGGILRKSSLRAIPNPRGATIRATSWLWGGLRVAITWLVGGYAHHPYTMRTLSVRHPYRSRTPWQRAMPWLACGYHHAH